MPAPVLVVLAVIIGYALGAWLENHRLRQQVQDLTARLEWSASHLRTALKDAEKKD